MLLYGSHKRVEKAPRRETTVKEGLTSTKNLACRSHPSQKQTLIKEEEKKTCPVYIMPAKSRTRLTSSDTAGTPPLTLSMMLLSTAYIAFIEVKRGNKYSGR